jgi:nucleotide-binding universal stress UspA family protein
MITYGSPVTEILKKATDDGVTLIVMGSQGRGYISELFLGSVSHNVARHAGVPVLLVPLPR